MTLTEFLLARFAEDAAVARALADSTWQDGWDGLTSESWTHFQRFDPARVLTECEAKRRIVTLCETGPDPVVGSYRTDVQAWDGTSWVSTGVHDWVLLLLALPYAGHVDYLPEWRP